MKKPNISPQKRITINTMSLYNKNDPKSFCNIQKIDSMLTQYLHKIDFKIAIYTYLICKLWKLLIYLFLILLIYVIETIVYDFKLMFSISIN